jgi:hypothetical protein
MDLPHQRVVARYRQARDEGPRARAALNNARILINNLIDEAGRDSSDLNVVAGKIESVIQEITKSTFGLHLDSVKKHITGQDGVIGNLKYALAGVASGDRRDVQVGLSRAWTFLGGAIDELAENPDDEEKKQQLSGLLFSLVPNGNTQERWLEQAIKLSKQLAATQTGKKQAFFAELVTGLQAALDGHLELRRAAAFAFKMLPKVR